MKTGLVILLLFLACSLKAPPLPPPPNRSAGSPPDTRMSFTNSDHAVITITNRIPPAPDPARSAAKNSQAQNPAVNTNTAAVSAPEPAIQASVPMMRIWGFAAIGALILCLLLAIFRKK